MEIKVRDYQLNEQGKVFVKINVYFDENVYLLAYLQQEIQEILGKLLMSDNLERSEKELNQFFQDKIKTGVAFVESDEKPIIPMMLFVKEPLFDLY